MRTHSSAMRCADSSGSQARRPKAYQLAWSKCEPVQLRSAPMLETPAMPVLLVAVQLAVDDLRHRRSLALHHACPHPAPLRTAVPRYARCVAKPEVFLGDLEFHHQRRLRHGAEQRMERLARLKIDGAVLHLHQHVVGELAVERHELVVGLLGAIVGRFIRIDERAPDHDAAVRRQRPRPACWRRRHACACSPAARAALRSSP